MLMNALKKVARGERTTIVVIALVAAVALVLGVGGFFMARTFLTSTDSGTTASRASVRFKRRDERRLLVQRDFTGARHRAAVRGGCSHPGGHGLEHAPV